MKCSPRILVLLAVLFCVGADAADDKAVKKELLDAVVKLNKAFGDRDPKAIKPLITDDHLAILSLGEKRTGRYELAHLDDYTYSSYETRDVEVKSLSKDVALVTFRVLVRGTFKGRPYPPENLCVSVFVKKDGKWLETYYQETAVPQAKPQK